MRAEKAGHTGTLDPLATGLLPLCFGAATKFTQVSLDADKAYRATLQPGPRTEHGRRRRRGAASSAPVTGRPRSDRAALARSPAPIDQVPPMHSALKHDGKALYEYARAGIDGRARAARAVTIHRIDIVDVAGDDAAA